MQASRKAVSPLISGAIYLGVGATVIAILVTGVMSITDNLGDTRAINQMMDSLGELNNVIQAVTETGEGTTVQSTLRFSKGRLRIDPGSNTIEYLIDTESPIISPKSSRTVGNIRISAGASVNVNITTVNGVECWRLRNDHISACIRKIGQGPAAGLVGYWNAEGRGQTLVDQSGKGNNGTLGSTSGTDGNDPERTSGCYVGNCLLFDGSNDFATAPDLGINGSITVMAWFRLDEAPGSNPNNAIIVSDASGSIQEGFQLHFNDGRLEGTIRDGTQTATVTSRQFGSDEVGEWHHVALRFDDSSDNTSLYLNGDLSDWNGSASTQVNSGRGIVIGSYHSAPSQEFNGAIDEAAVYSYPMSDKELKARYRTLIYDQSFFRTDNLLVRHQNTDSDTTLTDPSISARINSRTTSAYGFGYTSVERTGLGLPTGSVTAHLRPISVVDYTMSFNVVSGADFIEVTVTPD
ncbi:MAG: LamG domain-containing protein [Candidatus Nanohaloarchaea archaeon]|nr:LamG domain-containing protein [Candidatus Nanohaloarchaea archaeon]